MKENQITLEWKYDQKIKSEALGRDKYSKAFTALCELISNGFDAGALNVSIELEYNEMGGLSRIVVSDDGVGMSVDTIKETFVHVGNDYKKKNSTNILGRECIGRQGIGRFAVFRLGDRSTWITRSSSGDGTMSEIEFTLVQNAAEKPLKITSREFNGKAGTTVTIENLYHNKLESVFRNEKQLRLRLFSQYAVLLTQYRDLNISVNGVILKPKDYIKESKDERFTLESEESAYDANVKHVIWHESVSPPERAALVITVKGRIIEQSQLEHSTQDFKYAAFVSSEIIETLATSSNESILTMDPLYIQLVQLVNEKCRKFIIEKTNQTRKSFIEKARAKDYYPYKGEVRTYHDSINQVVYDNFLQVINVEIGIERHPEKLQRLIFTLLKKALQNHDLLHVLEEICSLSDEDTRAFRELLERTTLSSVIQLSTEIVERKQFLDELRALVYGELKSKVKERTQLHKILNSHIWLFGEQFNLGSSDKSFRTIVAKHRAKAGLYDLSNDQLSEIADVDRIPDLFLVSQKYQEYGKKHHHVIVELKAPKKKIDRECVDQIKDYAITIVKSPEFDKDNTTWEFFIVSTDIHEKVVFELKESEDHRPGNLLDQPDYKIFARTWGELIDERRAEMDFLLKNLHFHSNHSEEYNYFKAKFGHLLPEELQKAEPVEV